MLIDCESNNSFLKKLINIDIFVKDKRLIIHGYCSFGNQNNFDSVNPFSPVPISYVTRCIKGSCGLHLACELYFRNLCPKF